MEKLGLSDGGPTFKCGDGNAILSQWRNWGNKTSTLTNKEQDEQEWENIERESIASEPETEQQDISTF